MKVYGFSGFVTRGLVPGRQQRIIVAAQSLAAARRIVDASTVTGWPGREYVSDTGNAEELAIALAEPGAIFAQPLNPSDGREWVRLSEVPDA